MKRPAGSPSISPENPTTQSDSRALAAARQDWAEEAGRTAEAAEAASSGPHTLFAEFRRKLALGEALARAFEKLAEALHFSGRVTLTFHQGKLTKTVLEEAYFRGRPMS